VRKYAPAIQVEPVVQTTRVAPVVVTTTLMMLEVGATSTSVVAVRVTVVPVANVPALETRLTVEGATAAGGAPSAAARSAMIVEEGTAVRRPASSATITMLATLKRLDPITGSRLTLMASPPTSLAKRDHVVKIISF